MIEIMNFCSSYLDLETRPLHFKKLWMRYSYLIASIYRGILSWYFFIWTDQLEYLVLVLELLCQHPLVAKRSKCLFFIRISWLLGTYSIILRTQGLSVDPAKLETIQQWAPPRALKDYKFSSPYMLLQMIHPLLWFHWKINHWFDQEGGFSLDKRSSNNIQILKTK